MPGKRIERMTSIHFGKALGIVSMPAEPFVELGFAVKKASPFPFTMVAALGQGAFGYIGLPEHYEHGGGYETRPSPTAPDHNLAPKMIEIGIRLINK